MKNEIKNPHPVTLRENDPIEVAKTGIKTPELVALRDKNGANLNAAILSNLRGVVDVLDCGAMRIRFTNYYRSPEEVHITKQGSDSNWVLASKEEFLRMAISISTQLDLTMSSERVSLVEMINETPEKLRAQW